VQAQQQRANQRTVLVVAKAADHAVGAAEIFDHLHAAAVARAVIEIAALGDHAIERCAGAAEPIPWLVPGSCLTATAGCSANHGGIFDGTAPSRLGACRVVCRSTILQWRQPAGQTRSTGPVFPPQAYGCGWAPDERAVESRRMRKRRPPRQRSRRVEVRPRDEPLFSGID